MSRIIVRSDEDGLPGLRRSGQAPLVISESLVSLFLIPSIMLESLGITYCCKPVFERAFMSSPKQEKTAPVFTCESLGVAIGSRAYGK